MLRNRKPMERKTPMKRGRRLRPRSKTKAYARRPRDMEYLRWLKMHCCCAGCLWFAGLANYRHGIEAAHREVGGRAMGQKTPDAEAIPLCAKCHRLPGLHRHEKWLAMSKPARRDWWMERAAYLRAAYGQPVTATPRDEASK